MCPRIQITSKGIKSALKKFTPAQSVAEYVWNGFDAGATQVDVSFEADEIGNIASIKVVDNGHGIAHSDLQQRFEPLFESKKALEKVLAKNRSAIHGKNGIGRLTFFTFARNACWQTIYEKEGIRWTYDIFANAENINFYSGLGAHPKRTDDNCGTAVTFTGIHSINSFVLEKNIRDFFIREFAWFLELNRSNGVHLTFQGEDLDYSHLIGQRETVRLEHEQTGTPFDVSYVRWNERFASEQSKYYYLDSSGKEKWKEASAIKTKGEGFYHSVYIRSAYFDNFNFTPLLEDCQQPLMDGTRSDKQFRFLRRKIASFLRVRRRPFLREYAAKLLEDYEKKGAFKGITEAKRLKIAMGTLCEMQPRLFASLNMEQIRLVTNLMYFALCQKDSQPLLDILASVIELEENEKSELKALLEKK